VGQIEDLRVFVDIVDSAGIARAAEIQGIAKSAVSRRLKMLEDRYGTQLIDREPGVWKVTDAGRELYQRSVRIVQEIDEVESDFIGHSAAVEGPLSVSVPREFGMTFLNSSLIEFKNRYPQIQLTLTFMDRHVDLARENIDLAIRITEKPSSALNSTRIGTVKHNLFASGEYLSNHPPLKGLCDLHHHQLLNFGSTKRAFWDFVSPKGKRNRFEFKPYLNSNNGLFLLNAVRAGMGIARLPDFIVMAAEQSGEIVRVLPDMYIAHWGIFLVHAEDRRMNRRMRLFSDEMRKACVFEKYG
jgi:DNA-binding transcriptional LysR family regulator